MQSGCKSEYIVDVSREDDMYEILAGCDAFMTDYSSAAFDAAVMEIPIFLYCDDYDTYEQERGKLLWDLNSDALPFILTTNNLELQNKVEKFDSAIYNTSLKKMVIDTNMQEDGKAARNVVEHIGYFIRMK